MALSVGCLPLFLIALSISDVIVETLITLRIGAELDSLHFHHGSHWFTVGAFRTSEYSFAVSPLDAWIVCLFRSALSVGVALGFLYHAILVQRRCSEFARLRKMRSVLFGRLKGLRMPWVAMSMCVFVFVAAKFLLSMEYNANGSKTTTAAATSVSGLSDVQFVNGTVVTTTLATSTTKAAIHSVVKRHPWLWALLGWVLFTTVVQAILVYQLGQSARRMLQDNAGKSKAAKKRRPLLVNESAAHGSELDDVPLLSSGSCDEEIVSLGSDGSDSDSSSGSGDSSDTDSDNSSGSSDDQDSTDEDGSGGDKKKSKKKRHKGASSGDKPSSGSTIIKLLKQSLPDWPLICIAFIALLVSTAAQTLLPLYTGKVIDGIAIRRSAEEFHHAIVMMLILSIVGSLGAGVRGGVFTLVCARLNIRLRNRLFGSIVRQDMGFFDTTRTGDITSRLTSDTEKMSDLIAMNINVFARSVAKSIGVLFFMFKLSWKLTIVTLVSFPIITAVSYVYGKYYEKLSKQVQKSLAKANDVAEEVCSSMKTVRSFGWEAEEANNYRDKLKVTYRIQVKEALAYAGYQMTTSILDLSSQVIILFFGGYLVLNNELSAGYLVSFILYCLELGDCIEDAGDVFTGLMSASGAAQKVFKWIERTPDPMIVDDKDVPESVQGKVEFQDVSFTYPARPDCPVLKKVSFSVKPGEVVALVGPSGGGKSSCISLLERFYQPDSGTIRLDGQPLTSFDHKFLHSHISLVSQEPVLFARSIKDNVKYGLDSCPDGRVKEAAISANAHGFISSLPRGYRTSTGEKGHQLSGGQKQRVAIARSLIRRPSILLLDEATSALDAESEYVLQQSLLKAMADRTVLVVAHRLSTVEHATRIVVINDGQVVEEGSHTALLAADGLYAQLVQRQLHHDDREVSDSAGAAAQESPKTPASIHAARGTAAKRWQQRTAPSTSDSGDSSSEDDGRKRRR